MKKKRVHFLREYVIASDLDEANRIAHHGVYNTNKFKRFYELHGIERIGKLEFCLIFRMKELPSIRDYADFASSVVEESIERILSDKDFEFETLDEKIDSI